MSASQYVGIGIVVGYWAVLITTRWMFIARPNRRFTLARIDDAQYYLEPGGEPSLLDEARAVATGTHVPGDPNWLRQRRGLDPYEEDADAVRWIKRTARPVVRAADLERLARPGGVEPHAPGRGTRVGEAHGSRTGRRADARAEPARRASGGQAALLVECAQRSAEQLPQRAADRRAEGAGDPAQSAERALQRARHEVHQPRDPAEQGHVDGLHRARDLGRADQPGLRGPAAGGRRRRRAQPAPARVGAAGRAERLRALVVGAVPVPGVRRAVGVGRPAPAAVPAALQRDRPRAAAPRRHRPDRAVGSDPRVAILFGLSERIFDRIVRQTEDEIATKPTADKKVEPTAEPPRQPAPAAAGRRVWDRSDLRAGAPRFF